MVTALAQTTLLEALDRGRVTVVAPLMGTGVLWTVVFAAIFLGRSGLVGRHLVLVALLVVAGGILVGGGALTAALGIRRPPGRRVGGMGTSPVTRGAGAAAGGAVGSPRAPPPPRWGAPPRGGNGTVVDRAQELERRGEADVGDRRLRRRR